MDQTLLICVSYRIVERSKPILLLQGVEISPTLALHFGRRE